MTSNCQCILTDMQRLLELVQQTAHEWQFMLFTNILRSYNFISYDISRCSSAKFDHKHLDGRSAGKRPRERTT